MRILHLSPTFFSDRSIIGGGERFPIELAKAMSSSAEVVFLSFAEAAWSGCVDDLHIELIQLNELVRGDPLSQSPFSKALLQWFSWADVVHCHQVHTHITAAALLIGKLLGKRVFLTDLGGGTLRSLTYYLPILDLTDGLLLLSEYSRKLWKQRGPNGKLTRKRKIEVIYGGVDVDKFSPVSFERSKRALFVGRLLPHKGIDYAIEAMDDDLELDVVGRPYRQDYFESLQAKAVGKNVNFVTAADDCELISRYRKALVTISPSVFTASTGDYTAVPELLCLVALESMACGTPVIATEIASLPELIIDGVTGYLVPSNDSNSIRERVRYLAENPLLAAKMSADCRRHVIESFTWKRVANHCLSIYKRTN